MDVDSGAMGDFGDKVKQGRVLARHETEPTLPAPSASSPLVARRVRLVGLVTKSELNGITGTVLRVDTSTGKHIVKLDGHVDPVRADVKNLMLDACKAPDW